MGNKLFTDSNGIVGPVGSGCLYGLSDNVDPRAQLDYYASKIHFVRIFCGRLTPSSTRTGQSIQAVYDRLPNVMDMLIERNLRAELTCCTDTANGNSLAYNVENHVAEIASMAEHYREHVVGLEIWNEVGHSTQFPISKSGLLTLKDIAARDFSGPIALGAASIDENDSSGKYPTAWQGNNAYSTIHLNRDKKPSYREAFRIKEQYDVRNTNDCGACNNEPGRFDHESLDGEFDGMGHERFAYILGCLGVAWNFMNIAHGSQIRDAQVPTGVELSAFNAYLRGVSKIPRGNYTWFNANNTGNHPDSPVKNGGFMDGPSNNPDGALWRAYSFVGGPVNIVIAGGEDVNRFFLEYQNSWQPVELIDEFAQTQIIRIEQR